MEPEWILLLGIAIGWGFDQISRLVWYKINRKDRNLSIYQQASAKLHVLQDNLPRLRNFNDMKPFLDDFKEWHYHNDLNMNPRTNIALVAVINNIITKMLPEPAVSNILTIPDVYNAFVEAENSIRAATGQKIVNLMNDSVSNSLRNKISMSQATSYFFMGLMSLYASGIVQSESQQNAFISFGLVFLLYSIFLSLVTCITKFRNTIPRFMIDWIFGMQGAYTNFVVAFGVFGISFAISLARLAGPDRPDWQFIVAWFIGVMFLVIFYPLHFMQTHTQERRIQIGSRG